MGGVRKEPPPDFWDEFDAEQRRVDALNALTLRVRRNIDRLDQSAARLAEAHHAIPSKARRPEWQDVRFASLSKSF